MPGGGYTLTADLIRGRCITDPEGCLIWTGYRQGGTTPKMQNHGVGIYPGRALYELERGPIKSGYFRFSRCGKMDCISPECAMIMRRGKQMAMMNRRPNPEILSIRKRGENSPVRKLDWEKVRYIRSMKGKEKSRVLAAQFKVTPDNIRVIWRGDTWIDPQNFGMALFAAVNPKSRRAQQRANQQHNQERKIE